MLTMLPGLLTMRNSRSLSCSRIFTGVDVTGGSCLWTTFLSPRSGQSPSSVTVIKNTHSMRSPFLMIVSGFATLPLTVVTPDSSAYLLSPDERQNMLPSRRDNSHNILLIDL